jgi:hypothetical protein
MSVSLEVDYQKDSLGTQAGRDKIARAAKSVKNWGFFCVTVTIKEHTNA